MYYSAYSPDALNALAQRLAEDDGVVWCIFDNTAEGAATQDAVTLSDILLQSRAGSSANPSQALPSPQTA